MFAKADYSIVRSIGSAAVLVNVLYGTVDIVDEETLHAYQRDVEKLSENGREYLLKRRHLQEKTGAQRHVLDTLCESAQRNRKRSLRIYLPLTGSCNLSCSYCFQQGYGLRGKGPSLDGLRDMERGIAKALLHPSYAGHKAELVLYGGEPLLIENRLLVSEALRFASENGFSASIISNGTTLDSYLDLMLLYRETLRQVVVTLDGDRELHDACRHYPNGAGSYERITSNLTLLRENSLPYVMRINMDKELYAQLKQRKGQPPLLKGPVEIHRVMHRHYDENVSFASIMELCLDGKIDVADVAENQVVAFFNLMGTGRSFAPPLNNCPADSVLLFALDGRSLCSCNESRGDDMVVGSYGPEFRLVDLETSLMPMCGECVLRPLCAGGCRRVLEDVEKQEDCPFYKDILEMIDRYLERLMGGAHA